MIDLLIRNFDSASEASASAAGFILKKIKSAGKIKDRVSVVLAGGSAPRQLNTALLDRRGEINADRIDWFFGDERAVEPESPHSNYRMQMETLLGPLEISESRIHRIRGELGAVESARDYRQKLTEYFSGPTAFDIVILGLGPDGHTASLFPGDPSLSIDDVSVTTSAPAAMKPHVERVTLTFSAINNADTVMFFTGRSGKETVIDRLYSNSAGALETAYPFESVRPKSGPAIWFIYGSEV
ncbi:MAG: 6-phosphogluconolactonase [Spirochaetaceae bacterium]|nr:6-phosphogluconolactonase [Spirochaetaceae bacterium]